MAKRHKGPTIQELKDAIRGSFKRWEEIKKKGANELFFEDGVGLWLKRNHISYDQERLRELCKAENVRPCPKEASLKLPPKHRMNYCAKKSKSRPCVERRHGKKKVGTP
jgi:hypothetical protein